MSKGIAEEDNEKAKAMEDYERYKEKIAKNIQFDGKRANKSKNLQWWWKTNHFAEGRIEYTSQYFHIVVGSATYDRLGLQVLSTATHQLSWYFFRLFKLAVIFSHSPGSRKTSGWQLKLRLGWLGAPWASSQVQQSKMATWVLLNGRVGLTQTPAKVSFCGTFTFFL